MSTSFRHAFIVALGLHFAVGFVLFNSMHFSRQPRIHTLPQAPTIQATAVNSQDIDKALKRIETDKARQREAENQKIKAAEQLAEKAKSQKAEALKQVKDLKQQRQKLDAENLARQKEAARIKQETEKLAREQEATRQKLAELTKIQQKAQAATKAAEEKAKAAAELAEKKRQLELNEQAARVAAQQRRQEALQVGELERFRALIREAIRVEWVVPGDVDPTIVTQLLIRLAPGGDVLDVTVLKSSGDAILDHSAQRAVMKASPLPVPDDQQLFDKFRELRLTVRASGVENRFD